MLYQKISDIPISLKGRVAIKIHMGERGNSTHISPEDVRTVFDSLKRAGCDPFLVDTTSLYQGARNTPEGYAKVAKENGFSGFPVAIARDEDYVVKGGFRIAKAVLDADSLLVLSHGKGHEITAFGGAIKNLGMGCVNKQSKNQIHRPMTPKHVSSKCRKCHACEKVCPCAAIHVTERGVDIDEKECAGCQCCVETCPSGALKSDPAGTEKSFRLFSLAAKQVIDSFRLGRVAYITVLKNITQYCDCRPNAGAIVCQDIGYLSGKSALEIDLEAISLIKSKNPKALDFRTWSIFEREAKRVFG
jgi:uncharacterized Fe-S center protein